MKTLFSKKNKKPQQEKLNTNPEKAMEQKKETKKKAGIAEEIEKDIYVLLKEHLNLTDEEINKIRQEAEQHGTPIIPYLINVLKQTDEDAILKFFSNKYNIKEIDVTNKKVDENFDYYIKFRDGTIGIFYPSLKNVLKKQYPEANIGLVKFSFIKTGVITEEGLKGDILNILQEALKTETTDIHFEVKDFTVNMYFRILGEKIPYKHLEQEYANRLLKVLKSLCANFTPGFDPEEMRETQDARVKFNDLHLDLRLNFRPSAVVPTMQNWTARLLRTEQKTIKGVEDLYALGYFKEDVEVIVPFINLKAGLNLMSGATGSGKSKTFNTLLALIPENKKILSAEDPIEYKLPNAEQNQVLTFRKKLPEGDKIVTVGYMEYMRAFMRADPDVIFIGEWRKMPELTESLLYAVETGHLVFTTLHASRVTNVPSLLIEQYGLKPTDVANSINIIINQRLVKKVCPNCGHIKKITKEDVEEIKKYSRFSDIDKLDALIDMEYLSKGDGCDKCIIKNKEGKIMSKGYIGRTAIYEYLTLDKEVREKIISTVNTIEIEKLLIDKVKERKAKTFVDVVVEKLKDNQIDIITAKEGLM